MKADIKTLLDRGTAEIIVRRDLESKLKTGKKLRIKLGIDPTGSELHIGHAVVLKKLKEFQDAGHTAILLIGDYTAKIGDPTGKSETRVMMTDTEIAANMKDYIQQAGRILDTKNLEVRHNSEWFGKFTMADVLELTSKKTVAQLLQREDFKNRFKNDQDISTTELLYPIMQGYDSVMLDSDIEIGGTDQLFNMLVGRDLQKSLQKEVIQNIITVPILEGLDGVEKMSKSLGNYISMTESPGEMYGKTMSIPDKLICNYFELATYVTLDKISEIRKALQEGENPRNLKMRLAREIVAIYHGQPAATEAENNFIEVFRNRGVPEDITVSKLATAVWNIVDLLTETGLSKSKSEARRTIQGGGVRVDGTKIEAIENTLNINTEKLIQVGKRHFIKVVIDNKKA